MTEHPLDLDGLVGSLDTKRLADGISWRELARRAGVSASTLTRMQQGKRPDVDTFSALMRWLNVPAENFLAMKRTSSQDMSPAAAFAALMRSKRVKELPDHQRAAFEAVLHTALGMLKDPKE
jgi:transcriptional regulator with XRE-family HTH domain